MYNLVVGLVSVIIMTSDITFIDTVDTNGCEAECEVIVE
jgi:hypothetical protein